MACSMGVGRLDADERLAFVTGLSPVGGEWVVGSDTVVLLLRGWRCPLASSAWRWVEAMRIRSGLLGIGESGLRRAQTS
jgi:hypothetical protein